MARQYSFAQPQLPALLRYLFLSFCVAWLVILLQSNPGITQPLQQQAQTLLDRGSQQLAQGYPATAIESWRQAEHLYDQLGDSEGTTGSLINQSLAYQALGQYPNACKTLAQPLHFDNGICTALLQPQSEVDFKRRLLQALPQKFSPVQVLGLRNLGDVLRQMSQPEVSEAVLERGLLAAQALQTDSNGLRLSLAHTHRIRFQQSQNYWWGSKQEPELQAALQSAQLALKLNESVNQPGVSPALAITAQLQQLNLLLDIQQWARSAAPFQIPDLQSQAQQLPAQIVPLARNALSLNLASLRALELINAQLILADSLLKIQQIPELVVLSDDLGQSVAQTALGYAKTALLSAQQLGNWRLESAAAGIMGDSYTRLQSPLQAQQHYQIAVSRAQAAEAPDLTYRWQQRLGNLAEHQGNLAGARAHYQAAVADLNQVRQQGLRSSDPDYQFSFREQVEPIYQHYMRLLFDASNPNYEEILQVNEQLRLAELENYLQCGKLNLLSPTKLTGNHPTFIYVLNLGDRFEEIVLSTDGKLHHHSPKSTLLIENSNRLLTYLEGKTLALTLEATYQPYAQALYDQLIAPIKSFLPNHGTLVFSLDTSLQSIPMDLLFDGESYLFEHYSTALTLGSQIQPPQALPRNRLNALLAGLSQESPSLRSPQVRAGLEPLPDVQRELDSISKMTSSNRMLLNQAFTRQQFQNVVKSNNFPIVHVATHGQFSSDPRQTVILAWDTPINVSQFNTLLNGKQGNRLSLELLTLSACETAEGDERSALGLAGVALQAGARSTLASLWQVEEASTPELMTTFYKNLQAGMSKAEAKRQAQLTLKRNPQTDNPYLWAPFVLVGGWL